ncbi:hypothetical protein IWW36_000053 [Coemansia brasiliensis]|uniref:Cytosine-specific methyltransferase n=1 Tax=Coemansia brasiliensis TaxID=2650707 RepID=A0A9W8IBK1_9FUNG|nr:hypothetical protein IWW36_000053 [Coemansia brasiliensis]
MVSDFESSTGASVEKPLTQKRKHSTPASSLRGKEGEIYAADSSTGDATDLETSGIEDSRWEISGLKHKLAHTSLKAASTPRRLKNYMPEEEEEIEHADLEVLNESPVDDCEAEVNDDLPCRTLDDFVVFDQDNNNVIAELDELGLEGTDITISGNVAPLKAADLDGVSNNNQDEEDEDEDNGTDGQVPQGVDDQANSSKPACSNFTQRIRLSAILNYETYLNQSGQTEVWVRTCFAWYKLLNPLPGYMTVYSPLYKSVYIAHQAIERAKTDPTLTMAQFLRELRESPDDIISKLTPITDSDFRKYRESIIEEIQICLESTDHLELLSTPLIQTICRTKSAKSAKRAKSSTSSIQRGTRTTGKSIEIGEPKHENPACITPLIASIAQGLYARHLLSVSDFDKKQNVGKGSQTAAATTAAKASIDAWKKRYTDGSKAKTQMEDAKGIVSLADLQLHTKALCFQSNGVRRVPKSRLPQIREDQYNYSEVLIVPMGDDESDLSQEPIRICVGDTVLVNAHLPMPGFEPGSLWDSGDDDAVIMSDSGLVNPNGLARVIQITSIAYAIINERWIMHGRLLLPGRDTVLQEVALPNEWYLVDSCRSYCINTSLCGKIEIPFIQSQQEVDVNEWVGRLFCRFWYDSSCGMFEDVNMHAQAVDTRMPMWCRSCVRKAPRSIKLDKIVAGTRPSIPKADDLVADQRVVPDYLQTAVVGDVEYHVNDTVYILSEHSDQPFQIGYILRFASMATNGNNLKAEVQILKRVRVLPPNKRPPGDNHKYDDERHLFWTPLMQMHDVSSFRGKCWVAHLDEVGTNLDIYKDSDTNAFYSKYESTRLWPSSSKDWVELKPAGGDSDELMPMPAQCPVCKREREMRTKLMSQFLASPSTSPTNLMCGRQPLRALDLFSGCGGLTQGMDQSGIVKTLWSVEYMPSAGYSFAKNHPYAQVYNQCSNLLLDWAIKSHNGVPAQPLINKFDGKTLPPMPQPGDVDFIYCGPPCQGFSRCNRFIKADDIKTSLIANALSYVDFYRPTYFLLENVRGLLNYRLGGVQVGPGRVKGGIEMGMLKFILRALTTMGYQARFYVLQAGNYGLAQSRRRLFIWACKRGCKIPDIPRPITTFEKSNQTNINLPDGTVYAPFAHFNGNAPHHSITVEDAIGDLPKFEFLNPALVYPEDEERNVDWPQYVAVSGQPTDIPGDLDGSRGYVGHMEMQYSNQPMSEFQRLRRRKDQVCLPNSDPSYGELIDTLFNHVSRKFNAVNVERICRVVMEPGKDHSSLPEKLKPWCLSAKESAASRHNGWKGLYGRVNPKGCFGTALTEMSPMGKSGTVLLYDQRRVLSVRECARAQGFPDKFRLYSIKTNDTRDMHRQIGNAVPPPLAYALSLELRNALFSDFIKQLPDQECVINDILGDVYIDLSVDLTKPPVASKLAEPAASPDSDETALIGDEFFAKTESLAATC